MARPARTTTRKKPVRTKPSASTVKALLESIDDEQTAKDSLTLIQMMRRITGRPPKPWNVGTIGFDAYHFKYDSGREGDCHALGFYPRKNKLTVYLMDGTERHAELLALLGKHTTSRVCLYVQRLADVQLPVLERILERSYEYLKSNDGHVRRVE